MALTRAHVLLLAGLGLLAFAIGFTAYRLFSMRPAPVPTLGSRGERRQRALENSPVFRFIEPMVRQAGEWIGHLPLGAARNTVERKLLEAGYLLGLTADEFIALQCVLCLGGGGLGWVLGDNFGYPQSGMLLAAVLGFMYPLSMAEKERDRRYLEVARSLPVEIDLAAMCMNAGLDFPGAIRLIVDQRSDRDAVLREELGRILQELELGHTRATALRSFAARVPSLAVREFVGAVIQAEEKGTPLAEVLRIQATMLRMRRTILAEEAASRAGVFMTVPLVMLLASMMLVLMGSLIVKSVESGLL